MRRLTSYLIAGILLTASTAPVAADVLVLTDGTKLEGRIEPTTNRGRVALIRGAGRIELPESRISEVIEESDAVDFTHLGNQHLSLKNLDTAVQNFQMALEADPQLQVAIDGLAKAQAQIAAIEQQKQRELNEQLGQNLEIIPELIQNEAYEKAEEVLNGVLDNNPTTEQTARAQQLMRDLYLAWGFSRYDRLDYRGAEERYTKVLEMDPGNETALDKLLQIWQRDPTKRDQVLNIYQEKLKKDPNNLEFNRIVGEALHGKEQFADAIEPLKKVYGATRYAGYGLDRKLQDSYKNVIRGLETEENYNRAIATYEEMTQLFPSQDPAEITVLRYQRDRKQLAKDDYDGWANLVKRLYTEGLPVFAVREAELILRYAPQNEGALQILRTDATQRLAQVESSMSRGEYIVAREMADNFLTNENRFPDLIERAQELFNRADIEAARQIKAIKEQAREIAQRGDQYYSEALSFAEGLASDERDTSSRAVGFKSEAISRAQRAIDHYRTAIKMDPSLAGIEGMDLNSRLRDAQNLHNRLTDRPIYIRAPRNSNSTSSN